MQVCYSGEKALVPMQSSLTMFHGSLGMQLLEEEENRWILVPWGGPAGAVRIKGLS